jgi:hypothetical protein
MGLAAQESARTGQAISLTEGDYALQLLPPRDGVQNPLGDGP